MEPKPDAHFQGYGSVDGVVYRTRRLDLLLFSSTMVVEPMTEAEVLALFGPRRSSIPAYHTMVDLKRALLGPP